MLVSICKLFIGSGKATNSEQNVFICLQTPGLIMIQACVHTDRSGKQTNKQAHRTKNFVTFASISKTIATSLIDMIVDHYL